MKNVNLRVKHIYVGKKSRKGFTTSLFTFGSKTGRERVFNIST